MQAVRPEEPLVLLVEDDEDMRGLLNRWLRTLGAKTVGVAAAAAAVEFCRVTMPDVVITDLAMPHMDGRAFIESLVREFGDEAPPVLIVSGRLAAYGNQPWPLVEAVLEKPTTREEVLAAVGTCLDARAERNRATPA